MNNIYSFLTPTLSHLVTQWPNSKENIPLQKYVITLGSMGDGMLPASCQEKAVPVALCIGLWSHSQKDPAEIYRPISKKNENKNTCSTTDYLCTILS
jgi:hypothetical protein